MSASLRSVSASLGAIKASAVYVDNKGRTYGASIAPATVRDLIKSGKVQINGASRSYDGASGRSLRRLSVRGN